MSIGKFFGCVMMVAGSAIGAGILAMPMVSAFAGFTATVIVMLFLWAMMTISGLLIVEASLSLPKHACSFNSIAERSLGSLGKAVTWIAYLFLLYSSLIAYISGGSDLVFGIAKSKLNMEIDVWMIAAVFTVLLGSAVFWSTKATDYVNRGLISIKGFLLITTLVLISIYIKTGELFGSISKAQMGHVLVASPILLSLFNFHFIVPSIRMYVGEKPKMLRSIIITGSTLSLVLYLLWLATTLGAIPLEGEHSYTVIGKSLGEFTRVLTTIVSNKWVNLSIHGFINTSMTTAFLGVSLGLFDFLADGFKRPDTRWGRLQTAGLTFLPPLIVAVFYPDSFVKAFSYSGICAAVLFLVFPPIMVYRLRKVTKSSYRVACGKWIFAFISITGLIFTIFPLLDNLGVLRLV